MGRTAIVVTISLLGLVFQPGTGRAQDATDRLQYPLAPSKLTFRPSGGPVQFKAQWSGAQGTTFNPNAVGSAVAITADGKTTTTSLDPTKWKTLKKNRGFIYASNDGEVRSINLRMRKSGGGSIKIGATLAGEAASNIGVVLTIGPARWCSEFTGPFKRKRGRMVASSKTGPSTCPCAGGAESTWATIQTAILDRYGCTNVTCHGGAPNVVSNGSLQLTRDVAYANLIGVPSTRLPNLERVKRADRTHSLFWLKLAMKTAPQEYDSIATRLGITATAGSGMPLNEFKLTPDELEAVRLWIQNGAPETGVVPGTAQLLSACLPPPDPIKIAAPPVPAPSDGVQFYAPPWTINPRNAAGQNGESEVCHATWYDFSDRIPADMKLPASDPRCAYWGGDRDCFYYNKAALTQDPNSHHSIIHIYRGEYAAGSPEWYEGFGPFTCRTGERAGQACDPFGAADQCPGSQCGGRVQPSLACFFYGPPDFQAPAGNGGGASAPSVGGSQQPYSERNLPAGVYGIYPVKGTMIWNSHAFNVTDRPTTNEQYYNIYFAKSAADRRDPVRGIFDDSNIFVQNVPPFEQREYCDTFTLPQGSRLSDLSSHTHKRGILFRIWTPPNAPCPSLATCGPDTTRPPLVTTTIYNDPVQYDFDTPMTLDGADAASRTIKYCSLYDNGFTDPTTVKRRSQSPTAFIGGPCRADVVACLDGPKKGQLCGNNNAPDDRACDSAPGANDGKCDACPLRGGVTTEDEMYILLGSWYLPHCSDQQTNYDETDVDCGGSCFQCAIGQACARNADCYIGDCTGGVCQLDTP